jgi:L-fuculose-phosphate aldolase
LVNCIRVLVAEDLFELTYGHMSCRVPGTVDRFLILRNLHDEDRHPADALPEDIVEIDSDGETGIDGITGPGERFIHMALYEARPDVGAVVHCHPMVPTIFSIAGVEILPVDHLGLLFTPSVPIHDYSGQVDSKEKARAVAATMGEQVAVLLRSHGVAVVGRDIEGACVTTLALERTGRMQLLAAQIGTARPVPSENTMNDGRFSEGLSEKEYFATAWAHYARKHHALFV